MVFGYDVLVHHFVLTERREIGREGGGGMHLRESDEDQ